LQPRRVTADAATPLNLRNPSNTEVENVVLLAILALIALVLFGVGFTVHWLFILAVVFALIFLISLFAGGIGGRSRRAWW